MKSLKSMLVVFLVFSVILISSLQISVVEAEAKTVIVPDDYLTIVSAIGNASEGDTVFVRKGTYNETIDIDKTLSLIGEDRETTIIAGFRLDYGQPPPVITVKAPNVTISGFTITGSGNTGIWIEIRRDDIGHDGFNITGNNIINNGQAIRTVGINNCIISNNNIKENGEDGIHFVGADSTISGNNILGNGMGDGITVDFSHNVTITENQISGYEVGIKFYYIEQNGPIYVYENNITDNKGYGIRLWRECNNSLIFRNNIANNGVGIHLENVESDRVGMYNQVCNNNIVGNNQQVLVNPISDIVSWDNGKEGNFWSDYEGVDADGNGIGDTPYVIDENNIDHYPLMEPFDIPEFPSLTVLLIMMVTFAAVSIIFKRKLQN